MLGAELLGHALQFFQLWGRSIVLRTAPTSGRKEHYMAAPPLFGSRTSNLHRTRAARSRSAFKMGIAILLWSGSRRVPTLQSLMAITAARSPITTFVPGAALAGAQAQAAGSGPSPRLREFRGGQVEAAVQTHPKQTQHAALRI